MGSGAGERAATHRGHSAPVGAEGPLRVAAVILAAGRSTRMGRPKTDLAIAGRSLLEHVVDHALASSVEQVVVVVRPDARPAGGAGASQPERVRIVSGDASREGLSGSLRVGLAALPPDIDAAAILLADQPGVEAELIDRVIEAAAGAPGSAARPVYGHADQRVPGHPVVLPRAQFERAAALRGDDGARSLWRDDPSRLIEIETAGAPPPDVDTPEDYRRLCEAGLPGRG